MSNYNEQSVLFNLKDNRHTIEGDNSVKIVFLPFKKRSTLKGKNLLPLGANSFLLG